VSVELSTKPRKPKKIEEETEIEEESKGEDLQESLEVITPKIDQICRPRRIERFS
jgi:hypothetical protein